MKAFIEELKTQRIYRIAAGYLVSSWVILQIVSLLSSALNLPNWTLRAVLALLLVGFGIALVIGWRIDARTVQLSALDTKRPATRTHLIFLPLAALFVLGGAALIISTFLEASQASKPVNSELQNSASATESGTPVPELELTDGTRVSIGEQEVLLNDQDLGLRAMPTAGIGVIENRPGRVRLLVGAGNKTYLLEGVDLKHLNALPRLVFGPGAFVIIFPRICWTFWVAVLLGRQI